MQQFLSNPFSIVRNVYHGMELFHDLRLYVLINQRDERRFFQLCEYLFQMLTLLHIHHRGINDNHVRKQVVYLLRVMVIVGYDGAHFKLFFEFYQIFQTGGNDNRRLHNDNPVMSATLCHNAALVSKRTEQEFYPLSKNACLGPLPTKRCRTEDLFSLHPGRFLAKIS